MFQEHISHCAGLPDWNQEDADIYGGSGQLIRERRS